MWPLALFSVAPCRLPGAGLSLIELLATLATVTSAPGRDRRAGGDVVYGVRSRAQGLSMHPPLAALLALAALFNVSSGLANCFQDAGERYRIDPLLLYAIAQVESGLNPRARHDNRDGSRDIGLMQINSRHLPALAAFGIAERNLQEEPCTSVMAGAWILARFVQRLGYGWQAVGAYNAGTASERDARRERYAQQVWAYYAKLLERRRAGALHSGTRP
ncbi:soluble lytic murein transglycosylase-like protein [Pseudomonas asplenii]|uniref:Soluble lytic murein transglycosylase-like protein n=2 Tax=Pseudomonas asplenii TaxID=53407 RepID=A0A0M9GC64_9PSED|nr:soluble lytic murein transglycosylase-like protein [Pseudomonas fuscovaginae]